MSKKRVTKPRKLSVRQEKFCELIASGVSQTEAWIQAGYKVTRDSARNNATKAMAKSNVSERIAELRKPQKESAAMTKERKHELLKEIAEDVTAQKSTRISAMAEDSKLAGHYAPEKHEVNNSIEFVKTARERALAIASPLNRLKK